MFNTGWINDLDMLAQGGVIGFDAASYVTGGTPRYTGNPAGPRFDLPQIQNSPANDTFAGQNNDKFKNPFWKKVLLAGTAAAALLWGIFKIVKRKHP